MNAPKNIPADVKGTKFGSSIDVGNTENDPEEKKSGEIPLNKGSNVAGYTY